MSDLISREKLLDYLQMIPIDLGYREVESIRTFVKHMPPAQEWIPVTERSPEKEGLYLISHRNGKVLLDKWLGDDGWDTFISVTAWMPLPEPYKRG